MEEEVETFRPGELINDLQDAAGSWGGGVVGVPTGLVPVDKGFGDYHSGRHAAPPPGLPRRSEGLAGADRSSQTAFHRDEPGGANEDSVRAG